MLKDVSFEDRSTMGQIHVSNWLNTHVINHMITSTLNVPHESADKCVLMSTLTFTHTGLSDDLRLWSHGGSICSHLADSLSVFTFSLTCTLEQQQQQKCSLDKRVQR